MIKIMKKMIKKIIGRHIISRIIFLLITISVVIDFPILSFSDEAGWNDKQLQKIDKTKNKFSFAVFGDTRDSGGRFEDLIKKLSRDDVVFAMDIGDLVTHGRKEEFIPLMRQIKELNKPFLAVAGNHDLINNEPTNYCEFFGRRYYSFYIGNSYFIIVDNSKKTALDEKQMSWLEEELRNSQKYKFRFVFMHIPLYDSRESKYTKGHSLNSLSFAKVLNDLFDKNRVTMLFASHIHGYFRGRWQKTPYIITGGGGAGLHGNDPENYFFHYIKVDVLDSIVRYSVQRLKD